MKNPNLAAIYDDRSFAGHPGGLGILAVGDVYKRQEDHLFHG